MMSICLLSEVKQQWATLLLGWMTTLCTTRVSDGFAAHASRLKPLSVCSNYILSCQYDKQSCPLIA